MHSFKLGKIVLAALLLAFSTVSQASLITFTFTTDLPSPSADGFFGGYITFDSSDVSPGNSVSAASFVDWGFTFGSDMAIFAADGTASFVLGLDTITFDAFGGITSWAICVTTPGSGCSVSEFPGFYSDSAGNLNYTLGAGGVFNSNVNGSWEGVAVVPEPYTVFLFGMGLVALGLVRRRQ